MVDSLFFLREHEWKKHGTCCTDLPSLNSEHKYFDTGLTLNGKYDILRSVIGKTLSFRRRVTLSPFSGFQEFISS